MENNVNQFTLGLLYGTDFEQLEYKSNLGAIFLAFGSVRDGFFEFSFYFWINQCFKASLAIFSYQFLSC